MQGAFAEHQIMLKKVTAGKPLEIVLVRDEKELQRCDALIIPGGGQ